MFQSPSRSPGVTHPLPHQLLPLPAGRQIGPASPPPTALFSWPQLCIHQRAGETSPAPLMGRGPWESGVFRGGGGSQFGALRDLEALFSLLSALHLCAPNLLPLYGGIFAPSGFLRGCWTAVLMPITHKNPPSQATGSGLGEVPTPHPIPCLCLLRTVASCRLL